MSAEYFDCWSCHQKGEKKPEGPMEGWAPDLEISSQRLRRDWIVQWLRDPQKLMPGTKMPTYFEGSDSGPDEILGGDETKQIVAIVEYVLSLRSSPEKLSTYAAAKKRHPGATRAWGARLMSELNCAGCHDVGGMHERLEAGPPLAHEGSRVHKEWLAEFLKNPSQIRPIGYTKGHSSRMPTFRLSNEEAEAGGIPDDAEGQADPRRCETSHGPKGEGGTGCQAIRQPPLRGLPSDERPTAKERRREVQRTESGACRPAPQRGSPQGLAHGRRYPLRFEPRDGRPPARSGYGPYARAN